MIAQRKKISEKKAKDLIFALTRYGDHQNREHSDTLDKKQVEKWLLLNSNYRNFEKLVEDVRVWGTTVPCVEGNFIVGEFFVGSNSKNIKTQIIDKSNGRIISELNGSGVINQNDCQTTFLLALDSRNKAIQLQSIKHVQWSITQGISAIDAYIDNISSSYNQLNKNDQLIDSFQNKISREDKFKNWIPKITGGKKFDLVGAAYQKLICLEQIRNDGAVHPKGLYGNRSNEDLAKDLNNFRDGICRVLFDLHALFEKKIFRDLIRSCYMPDIYCE